MIDKEDDADKRRNTTKNVKLNEDLIPWKKEKIKNHKQNGRRKSSTKIRRIKSRDLKFK